MLLQRNATLEWKGQISVHTRHGCITAIILKVPEEKSSCIVPIIRNTEWSKMASSDRGGVEADRAGGAGESHLVVITQAPKNVTRTHTRAVCSFRSKLDLGGKTSAASRRTDGTARSWFP